MNEKVYGKRIVKIETDAFFDNTEYIRDKLEKAINALDDHQTDTATQFVKEALDRVNLQSFMGGFEDGN